MERARPAVLLSNAFEDYKATHMASRNMAPRTRVEYGRDVDGLIAYLHDGLHLDDPRSIELKHLEQYLAELDRRGLSGSSRRRKAAAIRSFFTFLDGHDYVTHNVAGRLRPPGRSGREPRVMSEAEYKRLQDACRFHPRDQAIIEVFLQTGIRLSELARLRTPASSPSGQSECGRRQTMRPDVRRVEHADADDPPNRADC